MTNKYKKAMDEIRTDDLFKRTIIRHTLERPTVQQTPDRRIRRKTVTLTAFTLILLLAIFVPLGARHSGTSQPSPLFGGFTVTAYAADGTSMTVKPEIEFPLGRYSMFMSSVPGFPVKISAEGADRIAIHSSEGQLLSWKPSDSRVREQGSHMETEPGGTFYWSPIEEQKSSTAAVGSTLEVTAYRGEQELGTGKIEIQSTDDDLYTAKWIDGRE